MAYPWNVKPRGTLLISRTFEVITPESAEHGDAAERGFVYEDRPMTFRDVVRELKEFQSLSCWPVSEAYVREQANVWATQDDGDTDYRTGEVTLEALHCDDSNPRARRWWALALRVAGLTQEKEN